MSAPRVKIAKAIALLKRVRGCARPACGAKPDGTCERCKQE